MNLPNKITAFRIILIPLFVISLLYSYAYNQYISLIIFFLAIITDGLDGFVARRQKQTTRLGAFLDPLTDKLLLASAFILLTKRGEFSLWVPVIVIGRDIFIVLGWITLNVIFNKNAIIPIISSKITAFLEMMLIFLVLFFALFPTNSVFEKIVFYNLWVMVIFIIISAFDYVVKAKRRVKLNNV